MPVDRDAPPNEARAIGAPARRALTAAGLTTWDAVEDASDADLLALHGFGPRALRLLREGSVGRGRAGPSTRPGATDPRR